MLEEFAQIFPYRPIYAVSALADIGLPELCQDLMGALQEHAQRVAEDVAFAELQKQLEARISSDVWAHSERMRQRQRNGPADREQLHTMDDFDDADATEVLYVRD